MWKSAESFAGTLSDQPMLSTLLRRYWTHLLIAFCDNYTREGFEKTQKPFALPENMQEMEPLRKREMTICNLFANQDLSIPEIVRVLDSSLHQVIPTLIENRLIKERRRDKRKRNSSKPESAAPAQRSSSLSMFAEEDQSKAAPRGSFRR